MPQGQTVSETVFLKSDGWHWEDGEQYTLVELPTNADYEFSRFDASPAESYTFTYRSAEDKIITCENTPVRWTAELIKVNSEGERLEGAVFALYSPAEETFAVPDAYADLNVDSVIERDGKSWYLVGMETTNADGYLLWSGLRQDRYYLLELKAPVGYQLPGENSQLIERKNETQGICTTTVTNFTGHELPASGGIGTGCYMAAGLLLMAGAGFLLLCGRKKRKAS